MKKNLVVALALIFILGTASVALAAPSPLPDVPAKHWAYDSVMKLAKAGVIEGYSDDTFRGDKIITRYEMAVIVAKALANQEKADASMKAEIARLQAEFCDELNKMGVRLAVLESKVGTVKFSGDVRFRAYQMNPGLQGKSDGTANISRTQERIRLSASATIDDNWTFNARFGAQGTTNKSNISSSGDFAFDKAEVVYKKDNFTGSLGRSALFLGQGALYDFSFDGIMLGISSGKFGAKGYIGDASLCNEVWGAKLTTNPTENFSAVDFAYAFDKNLSMTATYFNNISASY